MTELRVLHPKLPHFSDLDPRRFRFDLDRLSDTLYWDFFAEPRPAISYPVTDHVLYSVDAESEAVIGFQLDGFLAHFVYEAPIFLEMADLIGLTPSDVEDIRRKLGPEDRERAALRSVLGSIASECQTAAI